MENFIVSARKYRPVDFISVVGQQHITSTLKNAIERGQLAHAYLFCGPRGVGKTTCARIFAKAINCMNPKDNEACGECESCRSFAEGRSFSIHELDAASNNSVDDIRALTEQVRVPPQVGRYSVYIIDEVHMLSASAFNAFLKTLEEPPAHAIFILATTEKHKIIPTILSRCQIYDFNRIRVEDSVGYLKYIASQEGVSYDDESLNLIAQKADGGMRDALSMFDKAVAFCGNTLNFRDVARTLNVLDYDTYFTLLESVGAGDYRGALRIFDEVLCSGFSGQTFVAGLNIHLRDLLLSRDASTVPLLDVTGSLLERYRGQTAKFDTGFLFDAIALLSAVDGGLRTATNQRLHVELGLMKLCGMGQKKNSLEQDPPSLPELNRAGRGADLQHGAAETAVKETSAPEIAKEGISVADVVKEGTPAANIVEKESAAAESAEKKEPAATDITPKETMAGKVAAKEVATASAVEKDMPTKPTALPAAEKKNGGVSGVQINSILQNGAGKHSPAEQENGTQKARQQPDPDFGSKAAASREEFIASLKRHRPRFATAMSTMTIEGNTIRITVGNELLRDDMVQHRKEILDRLRSISGITGPIEMEVAVSEEKAALRPIKPEDKLNHLRAKNPLVDNLRHELGLEIE